MRRDEQPSERLRKIRRLDQTAFQSYLAAERAKSKMNPLQLVEKLLKEAEAKEKAKAKAKAGEAGSDDSGSGSGSGEEEDGDKMESAEGLGELSVALNTNDKPLYYWAGWRAPLSKGKNGGGGDWVVGLLEVGFAQCRLLTRSSKSVGTAALTREEKTVPSKENYDIKLQRVRIKSKVAVFLPGSVVAIGNKRVKCIPGQGPYRGCNRTFWKRA
ncbi:hypothetical protein Pelo_18694 [Pelomyxa schiedti]|nr:hypothetical protein Pelo_18694 [Pelomyxa schiedti]